MKLKREKMPRINTRVRTDQQKFVKDYAKEHKMTEGEAHRFIIDIFIKNTK